MNTDDFLELMRFPGEWKTWNMVPDEEFIRDMVMKLKPGEEHTPAHFRHEAFHYWLERKPPAAQLETLAELTFVDSDEEMGESIRAEIAKQPNCTTELRHRIAESR